MNGFCAYSTRPTPIRTEWSRRRRLKALAAKLEAETPAGSNRGDRGGPGARGGPDDRNERNGPPGGRQGGPPQPGQILPPMLQERLNLTAEQKKQVADLQKEVDEKLAKILTEEQMSQMKTAMRERGPGNRPPGPPPQAPE